MPDVNIMASSLTDPEHSLLPWVDTSTLFSRHRVLFYSGGSLVLYLTTFVLLFIGLFLCTLRAKYHKLKYGTELNQGEIKPPSYDSGETKCLLAVPLLQTADRKPNGQFG